MYLKNKSQRESDHIFNILRADFTRSIIRVKLIFTERGRGFLLILILFII